MLSNCLIKPLKTSLAFGGLKATRKYHSNRRESKYNRNDYQKGSWKPYAALGIASAVVYGYQSYGDQLVSDAALDSADRETIGALKNVCSCVITSPSKSKPYLAGQRIGKGTAVAVCKPKNLQEAVDVLQTCVDRDIAVISQGANTGLTGGSVPRDDIDRPVVIINMRNLMRITPVGQGDSTKMVCLPGSGILDLSKRAEACQRESHSILGSVFLNPSVAAGIAFGSGGTQVRKGPAYTERVVYAKVDANGKVIIVNDTGIKAKSTTELFHKLETGDIKEEDLDLSGKAKFWYETYPKHVSKLDSNVSRFNSYHHSPCEASRCEGKVLILGSVHQTFPCPRRKEVFWISSDDFKVMSDLRTKVALADPTGKTLPASCEYMSRDTIDITISHGTSACAAIIFGGMNNLARMYRLQAAVDKVLPLGLSDRFVQSLGVFVPRSTILPKPVLKQLIREHHVLLDMSEFGNGELRAIRKRFEKFLEEHGSKVQATKLNQEEIVKANIFRFTNAAAFKIYCLLKHRPGVSLDYALRKNDDTGFPVVPAAVHKRMVYGHFACNVIHDDIIFEKGVDPHKVKYQIKKVIENSGGILPAEHGHGTEYSGSAAFQEKLQKTDPLNIMNPGVAGTSPLKNYQ